ncbi:hypothetical protein B5C26_19090 [Photorhabdus luminescens]|uniref:hypothetical protein n=1 Tax=Photorhabdus luminescens TaxID=29488 RepID=UPI000B4DB8BC|nr:hypothetical protein [Photorhabdus luminescens]OWO80250.1 hypothetical protein B5C26_19090 [Photorhabdus luminescens]
MTTYIFILAFVYKIKVIVRGRATLPLPHHIPVIFQAASLLAALAHPGHIVIYAPGDSLPCRRDAS